MLTIKSWWLAVLVVAVAGLAAACSRPGATPVGEQSDDPPLKIGVITAVGKVDDRSFNQLSWEGAQQGAAAIGGDVSYLESESEKDHEKHINTYVERDADVIVTVGFALGEATTAAAKNHPDMIFIGVDQDQTETLPNLAGLIVPSDHAGFLAGALAGLLTQSNTVAIVLGTDEIPPVVAFKEG